MGPRAKFSASMQVPVLKNSVSKMFSVKSNVILLLDKEIGEKAETGPCWSTSYARKPGYC